MQERGHDQKEQEPDNEAIPEARFDMGQIVITLGALASLGMSADTSSIACQAR
jgi:hypothetical protein